MIKQYKKISARVYIFATSLVLVFAPSVSFAQNTGPAGVIQNPLGNITSIPTLIAVIMVYVVRIGGIIAIFAFIYSGFKFVQARGNPAELEKARDIFFYTCIAVAILLGAQLIASIIVSSIRNLQS